MFSRCSRSPFIRPSVSLSLSLSPVCEKTHCRGSRKWPRHNRKTRAAAATAQHTNEEESAAEERNIPKRCVVCVPALTLEVAKPHRARKGGAGTDLT